MLERLEPRKAQTAQHALCINLPDNDVFYQVHPGQGLRLRVDPSFTMSTRRMNHPSRNLFSCDRPPTPRLRRAGPLLPKHEGDELAGPASRSAKGAKAGGARRDRTDDLMLAKHALYQLSYGPHV